MTARPELPPATEVRQLGRDGPWALYDTPDYLHPLVYQTREDLVRCAWARCETPDPWVVYADNLEANANVYLHRISTALDMLAANGCDCECGCDSNHDGCERCLACRIDAALAGLEVTP